ncbi:MAG: hypothetical protein HQM16_12585 [Deltaproteobacteria bacterium]|nr:hypothetical protein [Deltaproteobacteria bacterium]
MTAKPPQGTPLGAPPVINEPTDSVFTAYKKDPRLDKAVLKNKIPPSADLHTAFVKKSLP